MQFHCLIPDPHNPPPSPPPTRAVYVYISHRLFELTNALKDAFIPHDDNRTLGRNLLLMGALAAGAGAAGWVVERAVVLKLMGG